MIDSFAQYGFACFPKISGRSKRLSRVWWTRIKAANTTVADTKATMDKNKKDYDDGIAKATANTAEVATARDAAVAQLAEQTKKYNDAVAEVRTTIDKLAKEKADINATLDKTKADYEKRIAGLGVRVAQLTKENTE